MANFDGTFGGHPFILRLNISEVSVDTPNNQSTVSWNIQVIKNSANTPYRTDAAATWSANIGGVGYGGNWGPYNFNGAVGQTITIASGSTTFTHNSDGTLTIGVSSSANAASTITTASNSGALALSNIARASTPTYSPNPVDAGVSTTITTNRADSTFTHDITYAIGSTSGTIATGVGASTSWTPPLSLMTEFPNSATGVVTITTVTKNSGGTAIGTTVTSLTVTAPSTAIPTFTTVTKTEATTSPVNIATTVGAFVQNLTTLALAITGAAGIYGSTIASYKITVAGQTINSSSGTSAPINASGTVAIVGTITDSRGRSASQTINITVLAYTAPLINTATLQRSLSDGTPSESGTYIRVNLNAAVSSLIVSTVQKNDLVYNIYVRTRGSSSWGTVAKTVDTHAVTFNSFDEVGTYALTTAWEVLVTVTDKFNASNPTQFQGVVATGTIFMHWVGLADGGGLGIGKFWETGRGAVDVKGQMYQNDGFAVVDVGDVATPTDIATGTDNVKYVSPAGLASRGPTFTGVVKASLVSNNLAVTLDSGQAYTGDVTPLLSARIPALNDGVRVLMDRLPGGTYVIVNTIFNPNASYQNSGPIPLLNGYRNYSSWNQVGVTSNYTPPIAERTMHGWVMVHALVQTLSAQTAGTVVLTLPPIYRPLQEKRFLGSNSATAGRGIIVKTNGDVICDVAVGAGELLAFCFNFNNDASLTRSAITLNTAGGWSAYGASPYGGTSVPQYAQDASNRLIYEGLVKGATAGYVTAALPSGKYQSTTGSLHKTYELSQATRFSRIDATGSPVATTAGRFNNAGGAYTGQSLDISEITDGTVTSSAIGLAFASGSNYANGWTAGQIVQMADGAVKLRGMVAGSLSIQLPSYLAPKYRILFPVEMSDTMGRVDVNTDGVLNYQAGSPTTFISLEDIDWMPAYLSS